MIQASSMLNAFSASIKIPGFDGSLTDDIVSTRESTGYFKDSYQCNLTAFGNDDKNSAKGFSGRLRHLLTRKEIKSQQKHRREEQSYVGLKLALSDGKDEEEQRAMRAQRQAKQKECLRPSLHHPTQLDLDIGGRLSDYASTRIPPQDVLGSSEHSQESSKRMSLERGAMADQASLNPLRPPSVYDNVTISPPSPFMEYGNVMFSPCFRLDEDEYLIAYERSPVSTPSPPPLRKESMSRVGLKTQNKRGCNSASLPRRAATLNSADLHLKKKLLMNEKNSLKCGTSTSLQNEHLSAGDESLVIYEALPDCIPPPIPAHRSKNNIRKSSSPSCSSRSIEHEDRPPIPPVRKQSMSRVGLKDQNKRGCNSATLPRRAATLNRADLHLKKKLLMNEKNSLKCGSLTSLQNEHLSSEYESLVIYEALPECIPPPIPARGSNSIPAVSEESLESIV